MIASKPFTESELAVAFTVVHVVAAVVLYCTVYPVAPETAPQFKVAPVWAMFVLDNCVGAEQEVDPVVEKLTLGAKSEQSAFTLQL